MWWWLAVARFPFLVADVLGLSIYLNLLTVFLFAV
ncbi:Protein of unknown function [Leuconostoc citreum LBAE C10]|nr:Protein of unknown function [Leuconostoc citreum LBAE C10]